MTNNLFAVLYTDGGCKPSRGIGGWGVHGYFYDASAPKTGTGQKDWFITPGGYLNKKKPGTNAERMIRWARLPELAADPKVSDVNVLHYVDMVGSLIPESTNNVAELTAALRAFEELLLHPVQHALLILDSRYVLDGITQWTEGWQRNNWIKGDGTPVANAEVWQVLVTVRDQLLAKGVELSYAWVKGHQGDQDGEVDDLGNGIVDHYASSGIVAGRRGIVLNERRLTEGKGYWNPKVEVNRLFAHSRWYFTTAEKTIPTTEDGRTIYHLGDHGKEDDFLCKPMADASFSVLYLREPQPILEQIRSVQREEDVDHFNSFIIGRLDFLFKPDVYLDIERYGGNFLLRRSHKLDLYHLKDMQLTKELRPPRLAFSLVDIMTVLENLLNRTLQGHVDEGMRVTDITDLIYEASLKGTKRIVKIRPEFTSAVKSVSVTLDHPVVANPDPCKVTLTFGMDLPHRNALAAIAEREPRVKVVTWLESDRAFRYATVVEAGEDAGIFAGFYSNIHLLN